MTDRETVITHLQIIHTWASFARERDLQFFTAKHLDDIAQWTADALTLLKEQEEVEPTINEYGEAYCICGENVGIIPSSKNLPSILSIYCSKCGRRMKWNMPNRDWYCADGKRKKDDETD